MDYILILIIFICILAVFSIIWGNRTFSVKTLNQMIYHLLVPCDGTDEGIYKDWGIYSIPKAILVTILLCLLIFYTPLQFILEFRKMIMIVSIVGTILYALINYQIISYVFDLVRVSDLYEKYYVDPKSVELNFKQKRNLIHIYLESIENTYLSKEDGGQEENNFIKELGCLAKDNINFSHNEKIGGSYTVEGTQWTIASMVAQEAGIPLLLPLSHDKYDHTSIFLPGVYSMGEILEDQGYVNELLIGSDANFACASNFYKQHGNFSVVDLLKIKEEGRIPEDYQVFWGFEDQKLFKFAKEDITKLAKSKRPFFINIETVDTHTPDGYVCEKCQHEYDNQYANVIRCQSKQVAEFVHWCKEQDWYENTTIVITGDHNSMSEKFFTNLDKKYIRTPYNCFINSAVETTYQKNRKFAIFDFYPTILASLGVEIKGERLGLGTNLFSGKRTVLEEIGFKKLDSDIRKRSKFYSRKILGKKS